MENIEHKLYDVVTVGERGQIVIPIKARNDFKIGPGDQLMVFKGMGDVGIILMNAKNVSNVFSNIVRSISKIQRKVRQKIKRK